MNVVQRVIRAIVDPGEPAGLPAGMMQGLGRGTGEPPTRGTAAQLQAYNTMPWLRAVTGKVATSVAATSCTWRLLHASDRTRSSAKMLQKAPPTVRDKVVAKRLREGTLIEVTDHPLLSALGRGNDAMTGLSLFETTQVSLDLVGESFWGIEVNALGVPAKFWPIPSHWVQNTPSPDRPFFRVSYRAWQEELPEAAVLWMRKSNPADPYSRGSGLARALADELQTDEYASQFQKAFFYNQAKPDLIVFPKQQGPQDTGLKASEVSRLEESWLSRHSGFLRAFKPMFVGREIGIHELRHDLKNIDVSALRKFSRDLVISVYGVPPEQLGILESSNRATISASDFLFQKSVIVPRMEFLRTQLQERLIPLYDDRLILDYISPIEEDREHALKVAQAAPWALSVNEWREMMNLERLPGDEGEEYMFSGNEVSMRRHRDRRNRFSDM